MYARHRQSQPRGRSVLKNGSTYTVIDTPTSDQCNAADIFYLGGHIYLVSDEEAASLLAAGFTLYQDFFDLITELGDDITSELGDDLEVYG